LGGKDLDERRFDSLIKALAFVSRRTALRAAAKGALGLAFARGVPGGLEVQEAIAKGCRKKRKDCKRDRQCCSGICKKRTCRQAPTQLTCTIRKNFCESGLEETACGTTNGGDPCVCVVTTSGASFCGNIADIECVPCIGSGDCAAVAGPGSACVQAVGNCLCNDGGATMCIPPCVLDPVRANDGD